jgi:SOS-response transcriptional repressor LexA
MIERRRVAKVDWARALKCAMACRKDIKTQLVLARKSGVAQSTVGRILRGEVDPQSGNLEKIANALRLSIAELAGMGQEGEPAAEPTSVDKLVERFTRVAVVSWGQAAAFIDSLDNPQSGGDEEWMPRPKNSGGRTFALKVRGESMEPGYQHGDIIFVDPDVAPKHGKDVVVRLNDRNEVAFRRLIVDGEVEYLRPTNPNWPGKIVGIFDCPGTRIIGVVIGRWSEK